jgi:hypothetical protein
MDISTLLKNAATSGSGGDILRYVAGQSGSWVAKLKAEEDYVLRLADDDDQVTLAGPLDLTVAVETANEFQPISSGVHGSCACEHKELWSYEVSIPAGHTWSYDVKQLAGYRVGANRGCRVVIRKRRPRPSTPTQSSADLPCNYAVDNLPDTGRFFPSGCEPCGNAPVRPVAPECGPRVDVPLASGGCVRPRFYNGMAIAREDLETELRYLRLKLKLHNRAAGAGVVWGLDTALRGSRVVVGPGYGVDCCGNDLTVTCDYAVDTQALLRDPAICRDIRHGQTCFALLLEYVECPQDPRPVHGNGCSPHLASCEYSRIRETVRLRLVPPRELPENAIQAFYQRVVVASKDTTTAVKAAATSETWQPAPLDTAIPWNVRVSTAQGAPATRVLQPSTTSAVEDILPLEKPNHAITVTITLGSGVRVVSGLIKNDAGGNLPLQAPSVTFPSISSKPSTITVDWETTNGNHLRGSTVINLTPEGGDYTIGVIRDIANANAYIYFPPGVLPAVGSTLSLLGPTGSVIGRLRVTKHTGGQTEAKAIEATTQALMRRGMQVATGSGPGLRIAVAQSAVEVAVTATGLPCCGGTCCAPTPELSSLEGLRLLILALLYGKLVQLAAQTHGAVASSMKRRHKTSDHQALIMLRLLANALKLSRTGLAAFETAAVELYQAWCAAGIYEGPVCRSELDGVIIGCATIKAGDICAIDALGGRRWVVHQPLIDHWSAQFGIPPLDLTADRLFAKLCCLSHLPGFGDLVPTRDQAFPPGEPSAEAPAELDASIYSTSMQPHLDLLREAPAAAPAGTAPRALQINRTVGVTTAAGTASTSALLTALTALPTMDLPRIAALVDLLLCHGASTPVQSAADTTKAKRVQAQVANSFNRLALARQPRPLMRSAAQEMAGVVLAAMPASSAVAADEATGAALAMAKVATVADLLGQEPEELHAAVGDTVTGAAIDEAVARAEDISERTAAAVGQATRALVKKGLTTPSDLDKPELVARLTKDIASRLAKHKITVDHEVVTRAIIALQG